MKTLRTINNVFKDIKTVDIRADCHICNNNIDAIKKDGLKRNEILLINPDFNASGVIIGYHIIIVNANKLPDIANKIKDRYAEANKEYNNL